MATLQVTIGFQPKGHTFNALDQTFSPTINALHRETLPTVSSLVSFLRRSLRPYSIREVQQLPHLWDFDKWIREHMHMLGGYAITKQSSGMHEFVFQLDSDNQVRLKARQSSQAATWLPEGEGILVFKSDPPDHGPPPIAGLAPDADWERQAVETTVRRWLPLLLGEQGLHAAESEWNDLLASLPSVASQIPSAEHLDWRQLPLVQPLGAAVTGGGRLDNSYMATWRPRLIRWRTRA